ncbi:hypothetical protein Tco_0461348 [Tanacetum coccineum]
MSLWPFLFKDLETKKSDARLECSSMVEHQPDSDGAHGGCKFKVRRCTDLPEQNHELAIELLGGRLELRNAEFSLLPMLENKNSLEWFVRKAQDRIVLSTLRRSLVKVASKSRLSIEYEDRDEMIVAHMVDAVDDFIKGALPTLLVKYPLKLPESKKEHPLTRPGLSIEYEDKDEMIVADMVDGVDAFIKVSQGWPIILH